MHGVDIGAARDVEQLCDVEIALRGGRSADRVGLVGEGSVKSAAVGVRVDGHPFDLELPQGAEDADRGLAPVGEQLVGGLRLAALERGVVIAARDLGKLKTWSQAVAAGVGGLAAAGVWSHSVSWWFMLLAVALTWLSGLDYARSAPRLLRGRAVPAP